jgi:hypothetical protein
MSELPEMHRAAVRLASSQHVGVLMLAEIAPEWTAAQRDAALREVVRSVRVGSRLDGVEAADVLPRINELICAAFIVGVATGREFPHVSDHDSKGSPHD